MAARRTSPPSLPSSPKEPPPDPADATFPSISPLHPLKHACKPPPVTGYSPPPWPRSCESSPAFLHATIAVTLAKHRGYVLAWRPLHPAGSTSHSSRLGAGTEAYPARVPSLPWRCAQKAARQNRRTLGAITEQTPPLPRHSRAQKPMGARPPPEKPACAATCRRRRHRTPS